MAAWYDYCCSILFRRLRQRGHAPYHRRHVDIPGMIIAGQESEQIHIWLPTELTYRPYADIAASHPG